MFKRLIKKASGVFELTKDRETVLFNVENGEFYGLQDTSAFIWSLLDGKTDANDVIDKIMQTYEGCSRETVENDVRETLDYLKGKGMLR